MERHFVEFDNVCKYYQMGENRIAAADHVSFFIDKGEFCVIVGPSGAGKTTVLNMLGGMDGCDEGRIYLDGQWRPAATGIGKRPTVDSSENAAVTCETFVPDFSGNVYGQQPVLEFHKYFCRCASSIRWTSWPR